MLRNIQGQNSAGYSGNLSDQAKKRTGIYQTASQPGVSSGEADNMTNRIINDTNPNAPGYVETGNRYESPSSNFKSPTVPGTVNVAGKPIQLPVQSSGKSGGFNRGPAAPTPGTQPGDGERTFTGGTPYFNESTGQRYNQQTGQWEDTDTSKEMDAERIRLGLPPRQRPVTSGQPMTLRDAFSTLQTAGYGSF